MVDVHEARACLATASLCDFDDIVSGRVLGASRHIQMILDMYSPDEVLVVNYIFTTVFSDYCNLLENLYD